MKKVIIGLILVLILSITYGESEEIIVGIYPNPPLLYEDEDGKAVGLFVDLLNDFGKKNNILMKRGKL